MWLLSKLPVFQAVNTWCPNFRTLTEHAFNTYLNAISIGKHFRCFHNVTIGGKEAKIPVVGDNVIVSCGKFCS